MSKTILAHVDGWTPVIDAVLDDVGIFSAMIFGRVWRYCQMKDGQCMASIDTIADEIHISRRTVERHLHRLVKKGYLIDLTPNRRNRPHTYADSGKAGLRVDLTAGATESRTTATLSRTDSCDLKSYEDTLRHNPRDLKYGEGTNHPSPSSTKEPDELILPVDLQPFLAKFLDLWQLNPPSLENRSVCAQWVKEIRRVKDACSEFGVYAIERAYGSWHREPFEVTHPGAIVKLCIDAVSRFRQGI
jgi:DNA-binding Lrp family transcriptional regulator